MLNYYMPTKIIWGNNVLLDNSNIFKEYGNKALIVTGKTSSKINGSLDDTIKTLELNKIEYKIFDQVEENPSIENVTQGASAYMEADFIIGIGGGSPIDAAKAIAVIIKNPNDNIRDLMYKDKNKKSIPVIAVPTTAGTGTEVTPYSILTDHENETKKSIVQLVYPEYALLDTKYFMTMSKKLRINTGIDALSHLVEGFLSNNANLLNDYIAIEGLRLWGLSKNNLDDENIEKEKMEHLILSSTLAGIVITQTKTSLPHGMGYPLTYYLDIPHGKANGILLAEYMKICNKERVNTIIETLGFKSVDELGEYLLSLLGGINITNDEIDLYTKAMTENVAKLSNHPYAVTYEDIYEVYKKSLMGDKN